MILILGGASSGKSRCAVEVAKAAEVMNHNARRVAFVPLLARHRVAPGLQARMDEQRRHRPAHWMQWEDDFEIDGLASRCSGESVGLVILDGINLWLGNELTVKGESYAPPVLESHCRKEAEALVRVVSNELAKLGVWSIVCSGIVNEGLPSVHDSGRLMREILSDVGSALAAQAQLVGVMESGLARVMKYPEAWFRQRIAGAGAFPVGLNPVLMMEPAMMAQAGFFAAPDVR